MGASARPCSQGCPRKVRKLFCCLEACLPRPWRLQYQDEDMPDSEEEEDDDEFELVMERSSSGRLVSPIDGQSSSSSSSNPLLSASEKRSSVSAYRSGNNSDSRYRNSHSGSSSSNSGTATTPGRRGEDSMALRPLPTIAQPPKPETLAALWREQQQGSSGLLLGTLQPQTGSSTRGGQEYDEPECVICLDTFTPDNPEMHTLCSCGENRSRFHYPCLLVYMEKTGASTCPSCRGPLFFEEYS